jgi:hypothetical protein
MYSFTSTNLPQHNHTTISLPPISQQQRANLTAQIPDQHKQAAIFNKRPRTTSSQPTTNLTQGQTYKREYLEQYMSAKPNTFQITPSIPKARIIRRKRPAKTYRQLEKERERKARRARKAAMQTKLEVKTQEIQEYDTAVVDWERDCAGEFSRLVLDMIAPEDDHDDADDEDDEAEEAEDKGP